MLIGDLSKKSGISRDTIRYYEKLGLIQLYKKERRDNNYKEYSTQILEKLILIKKLKFLGFTLHEIQEITNLYLGETNPCNDILDTVNNRLFQIEEKITELQQFKTRLTTIKNNCNGNCKLESILPTCLNQSNYEANT